MNTAIKVNLLSSHSFNRVSCGKKIKTKPNQTQLLGFVLNAIPIIDGWLHYDSSLLIYKVKGLQTVNGNMDFGKQGKTQFKAL